MDKELCSAETVQGFAATLVPLLLEIWVEAAGGGRVQTDSGHLLSAESMALMFQILSILQLLRRMTPQRDQQDVLVHSLTLQQLHYSCCRARATFVNPVSTVPCRMPGSETHT